MSIGREDFYWKLVHDPDLQYYLEHGIRNPNSDISQRLSFNFNPDKPFLSDEMKENFENGIAEYSRLIAESKDNLSRNYFYRGLFKFLLRDFVAAESDRKKCLEFITNVDGKFSIYQYTYLKTLQDVRYIEKRRRSQQDQQDQRELDKFYRGLCGCGEDPCICNKD